MTTEGRLGINGAGGEIGRAALRRTTGSQDNPFPAVRLVHVNNRTPIATPLLQYEQALGAHYAGYRVEGDKILTPRGTVGASWVSGIGEIPWQVDVVLDGTGVHKDGKSLDAYTQSGVKYTVVGCPLAKDVDPSVYPTIVWGVNQETFDPERHKGASASSCTSTALALTIRALGIQGSFIDCSIDTVHAYTPSQNRSQGTNSKAGGMVEDQEDNMIISTTGASKMMPLLYPGAPADEKANSIRVNASRTSLLIAHFLLKEPTSIEKLRESLEQNVYGTNLSQMVYVAERNEELLTSNRITSNPQTQRKGAVIIPDQISVKGGGFMVKVLAWYNNVDGFVEGWLKLANHVAETALASGAIS